MGWLESLGALAGGVAEGVQTGVRVRGDIERQRRIRMENDERQRELEEQAKSRGRMAEVDKEALESFKTPPAIRVAPGDENADAGAPVRMIGANAQVAPQDEGADAGAPIKMIGANVPPPVSPMDALKRRMEIAAKKGYTDVFSHWQGKLFDAISNDVKIKTSETEARLQPLVAAINEKRLIAQQSNQPLVLSAEEQKAEAELAGLRRANIYANFFDLRNPALRSGAIQKLGGALGLEGVTDIKLFSDPKTKQRMYIPVDKDGKPFLNDQSGRQVFFDADEVDEAVSKQFNLEPKMVVMPEGSQIGAIKNGKVSVVASNPRPAKTERAEMSPSELRQQVSDGIQIVKSSFPKDPATGELKDPAAFARAAADVERRVRAGESPAAAANAVADSIKRGSLLGGDATPSAPAADGASVLDRIVGAGPAPAPQAAPRAAAPAAPAAQTTPAASRPPAAPANNPAAAVASRVGAAAPIPSFASLPPPDFKSARDVQAQLPAAAVEVPKPKPGVAIVYDPAPNPREPLGNLMRANRLMLVLPDGRQIPYNSREAVLQWRSQNLVDDSAVKQ